MYPYKSTHIEDCPWTYGIIGPNPKDYGISIYGGFILVRTPPALPKLNHLVVIWTSVSSDKWFYQTSLGYYKDYGWHVSAGACSAKNFNYLIQIFHAVVPVPPFEIDDKVFRPQPDHIYEIGIRFNTKTRRWL